MCGGVEAPRSVDRSCQHDVSCRHVTVESMRDVPTMTESDLESGQWSVHGGVNLQPNAASADRLSSDRSRMTMQPSAALVTETLSASEPLSASAVQSSASLTHSGSPGAQSRHELSPMSPRLVDMHAAHAVNDLGALPCGLRSNATVEPRSATAYMAACMIVDSSHVDRPTGTSVCGGVRTTKSDARISSRLSQSDTKNSIRLSTRSSDAKNSIRQLKSDAKNSIRRSGQSAPARCHERWTTEVGWSTARARYGWANGDVSRSDRRIVDVSGDVVRVSVTFGSSRRPRTDRTRPHVPRQAKVESESLSVDDVSEPQSAAESVDVVTETLSVRVAEPQSAADVTPMAQSRIDEVSSPAVSKAGGVTDGDVTRCMSPLTTDGSTTVEGGAQPSSVNKSTCRSESALAPDSVLSIMTPTSLGGHDCDPSLSAVQALRLFDAPSDDMVGSVDKVDSVKIIRFDDRDESDDDIWRMDGPPPMDESSQSHSDSDVTEADRRHRPHGHPPRVVATI